MFSARRETKFSLSLSIFPIFQKYYNNSAFRDFIKGCYGAVDASESPLLFVFAGYAGVAHLCIEARPTVYLFKNVFLFYYYYFFNRSSYLLRQ